MIGKKGAEDEGNENEEGILEVPQAEGLPISTVVSTVPATTDQFMFTPAFMRHFVEFFTGDTLMRLRLSTKGWKAAVDAFIDEGVKSGEFIVHDGKGVDWNEVRVVMRKLATRVVFPLNITPVGNYACWSAVNLIVVDIPEGIESIGAVAFADCTSLTTVSFPRTFNYIGQSALQRCTSLDNVDLLHTNLQELGAQAFYECSELKSMKIPDSLQMFGDWVFDQCSKLVPSSIDISSFNQKASEVVAHLRSKQS